MKESEKTFLTCCNMILHESSWRSHIFTGETQYTILCLKKKYFHVMIKYSPLCLTVTDCINRPAGDYNSNIRCGSGHGFLSFSQDKVWLSVYLGWIPAQFTSASSCHTKSWNNGYQQ